MNDNYPMQLKQYGEIHGHICFGLAIGYRAGKCAQEEFGSYPAAAQAEVTALVKSGDCAREGILLVTPCSCQTWEMLQGGKYVFVFYHRTIGKALYLAARPEIMEAYQPIAELKTKMRHKTATDAEIKFFWKLNEYAVKHILELPPEKLFYLKRFEMALLVKLNPYEAVYVSKQDLITNNCLEAQEWGNLA